MILQLINRIVAGDANAFNRIIIDYKQMVFAVAIQIVADKSLAEDITQETFIKAYTHLKKFKGQSKFSTWLYRIAVNEALKVTKLSWYKNSSNIEGDNKHQNIAQVSEIDGLEQEDRRKIIASVMVLMKKNEALVLNLYYLQEQSMAEISIVLALKEKHVKVILYRARKSFYGILNNEIKHELCILK